MVHSCISDEYLDLPIFLFIFFSFDLVLFLCGHATKYVISNSQSAKGGGQRVFRYLEN